jgi:homoserine trans-succinylase
MLMFYAHYLNYYVYQQTPYDWNEQWTYRL